MSLGTLILGPMVFFFSLFFVIELDDLFIFYFRAFVFRIVFSKNAIFSSGLEVISGS